MSSAVEKYITESLTFSKVVSVFNGEVTQDENDDTVIISFDKASYNFIKATHSKILQKRRIRNIASINLNDLEVLSLKKKHPEKTIEECVSEIKSSYEAAYIKTLYQIICLSLMRSSIFYIKDGYLHNRFTKTDIKPASEIGNIEYMMSSVAFVINLSDDFSNLVSELASVIYHLIVLDSAGVEESEINRAIVEFTMPTAKRFFA